jgi:hypothetical protein
VDPDGDGDTEVVGEPDGDGAHAQATETTMTTTVIPTPTPPCTVDKQPEKSEIDSRVYTNQHPPKPPTPPPHPTTTDDGENLEPGADNGDPCLLETDSLVHKANFFTLHNDDISFLTMGCPTDVPPPTCTFDYNIGPTDYDWPNSFCFIVDDDENNITAPDAYKDDHKSGASIYSDSYATDQCQYIYSIQIIGTDMNDVTSYTTDFTCGIDNRLITDHDQYVYDRMTYNYGSFDNADPELSSKAPAAFRAYAYTLAKPCDTDDGNSYFL